MEVLSLLVLALIFPLVSPRFIGIQCGDNVCGRNSICEDGGNEETTPKCECATGYVGLPNDVCFKSCLTDSDCDGGQNECVFHDPYFPKYQNVNFFVYNYPYSHRRCRYDCESDADCGLNAICQAQDGGNSTLKLCACSNGYVGLPYMVCFDPTPDPIARIDNIEKEDSGEDVIKCPILEKTEGIKISCLDRDGGEHDCSTGGVPGTSAMFSCKTHFVPANYKMKYARMKCGSSGKWSQYKMFHCKQSTKFHYAKSSIIDSDYY